MQLDQHGIDFIKNEEGCRLKAYQDSVGVWTIGYGQTYYHGGEPVKQGDIITQQQAEEGLVQLLKRYSDATWKEGLTNNQHSALTSLCYNIGIHAYLGSTVHRLVEANPNDPEIKDAFLMWKNAGGKPVLLARRKREAELYFS